MHRSVHPTRYFAAIIVRVPDAIREHAKEQEKGHNRCNAQHWFEKFTGNDERRSVSEDHYIMRRGWNIYEVT
jgi:hypothetical protein